MVKHKAPEVRKNEILDAAQKLFIEKGYAKTTVADILSIDGLSKGVFYYYFESKEAVLDAVVARMVSSAVENAGRIAADPGMTVSEKLYAITAGAGQPEKVQKAKEDMMHHLHTAENAEMHQKTLVQGVKCLAPVITRLFEGSDSAGAPAVDYLPETVALLFAAQQFIFDEGLFDWSREERARYGSAFIHMLEKTLGFSTGTFDKVKDLFA